MTNFDSATAEHAWRYFEIHSTQRLTLFNYFLIASGAGATGLAATLQGSPRFAAIGIVLGATLVLASFLFWKIDQRTAFLVKHAEEALRDMESSSTTGQYRIFTNEPDATAAARSGKNNFKRLWSYREVFERIYVIVAIYGFFGAIVAGLKFLGSITF